MKLNKGYDQQATLPKRGEKKQQPIAPETKTPSQFKFLLWLTTGSDIYYQKTRDTEATKPITGDMGYPLGGCLMLIHLHLPFSWLIIFPPLLLVFSTCKH